MPTGSYVASSPSVIQHELDPSNTNYFKRLKIGFVVTIAGARGGVNEVKKGEEIFNLISHYHNIKLGTITTGKEREGRRRQRHRKTKREKDRLG